MKPRSKIDLEFFKGFFKNDSPQSMTRLLAFLLVVGGIVQIFVYSEHYLAGIEMITLGLGGKIVQKKLSETI